MRSRRRVAAWSVAAGVLLTLTIVSLLPVFVR
jgi:hypothetical protein